MILHTFKTSPYADNALNHAIPQLGEGDSLLLLQDAVYALNDSVLFNNLQALPVTLYCLNDDVKARGVQPPNEATMVSYEDFVALALAHSQVISW